MFTLGFIRSGAHKTRFSFASQPRRARLDNEELFSLLALDNKIPTKLREMIIEPLEGSSSPILGDGVRFDRLGGYVRKSSEESTSFFRGVRFGQRIFWIIPFGVLAQNAFHALREELTFEQRSYRKIPD